MKTLLEPPPLPVREDAGYREKIRNYAAARRSFFANGAVRRTLAIVIAAAFAVIAADVFFGLTVEVRWLALIGLLVTGIALLAHWWWRPARALGEAEAVREFERGFPELGQRLRTAYEVESSPATRSAGRALATALIAETRQRMASLDPQTLIPWSRLRGPLLASLGAIVVFGGALILWPEFRTGALRLIAPGAGFTFTNVTIEAAPAKFTDRESPRIVARLSGRAATDATLFTREDDGEWVATKMANADAPRRFDAVLTGRAKDFAYYIAAGDGRTAERRMRCLLSPKIEKVFALLDFPDYTGIAQQQSDGGDVRAVEGTKARVTFQLNHALATAGALTKNGTELPISISGNELVIEQTLARGELVWQLTGRDAEGIDLTPASYKFIGLEDKIPEVKLVEPSKDLSATSVWEVLARLEARDDFGLAEVGIILVVGGDMKLLAQREIAEKDVRRAGEMGTALLEEFPLTINDNLKLYAYARDHKPRDGARSVSNLRAIDIRQFKTRFAFMKGGMSPMSGSQLQKLMDLIKEQRRVVSEVFVLKENGVPADGDLGKECDTIREREEKLGERALALKVEVEEAGTMNRDDLALLDTAAQQMGEAAKHLQGRLLQPAYRQADRALSSLLALRKQIMRILSDSKSPTPQDPEDREPEKSLTDFARECERLAGEERGVREKVSPEAPPARDLEVLRHQQEVAVTDAGELFAALVGHPQATELALQHMDEAEKEMQQAEEKLRNAAAPEAAPGLQSAEEKLLALAAQLRALDEKNLIETLGKLADQAARAKEKLEQEKKERGGEKDADAKKGEQPANGDKPEGKDGKGKDEGDKPGGDKPGGGRPGGDKPGGDKPGGDKPGGDKPGGDKPGGDKPGGDKPGGDKPGGDKPGGDKPGGDKPGGDKPGGDKPGGDKPGGDKPGGDKPGGDKPGGDKPGGDKPGGDKPSLDQIEKQSATLDDILKGLSENKDAGTIGGRLGELRAEAKTDALSGDVRDLKGEQGTAKAGERAGDLAGRFDKIAESLTREQRRLQQSRIENISKALARTKELRAEAAQKANQPSGQDSAKAGDGKDGKDGKKAGAAQTGKNERTGGGNPLTQSRNRRGAAAASDVNASYLEDLEELQDDVVVVLLKPLSEDLERGPFNDANLKPVEDRLGKIIDDLLRPNPANRRNERIPDEYGHMVDEYFRALSDDFGGEEWNKEEK